MRRLLFLLGLLSVAGPPALAVDFYLAPDAPVDLVGVGTSLPWTVTRHNTPFTYTTVLAQPLPLPFNTHTDALHLMNVGDWLFSVDAPMTIAGDDFQPGDVVRYSQAFGTYTTIFCASGAGIGAGPSADVDAVFLTMQRDTGNLVVSFEAPTTIGGVTYEPADLIEFTSTGPACDNWALVALYFEASAAVPPIPPGVNVTGADEYGLGAPLVRVALVFDAPVTLAGTTYRPGELVLWDPNTLTFSLLHSDPAWSMGSHHNALSMLSAPGTVPTLIKVNKAGGGQITVEWTLAASCQPGDNYGVYEGVIGSWYSHVPVVCTDAAADLMETFLPGAGNRYYLVVPNTSNADGGYGTRTAPVMQRPHFPGTACRPVQEISCP